jgi:hypothetical protein
MLNGRMPVTLTAIFHRHPPRAGFRSQLFHTVCDLVFSPTSASQLIQSFVVRPQGESFIAKVSYVFHDYPFIFLTLRTISAFVPSDTSRISLVPETTVT